MRPLLALTILVAGCATALGSGSGAWGTAQPVPGVSLQALMTGYTAPDYVGASCSSPLNCTVTYQQPKSTQVFSVTRHDGIWGSPRQVPGLHAAPGLLSLACVSPGDCLLAANARGTHGAPEVMVARLAHGGWTGARPVPGLAALRPGQWSQVSSLACGRSGWCALSGLTFPPAKYGHGQPFVASEHNGTWSTAQAVPGLASLTRGWAADAAMVSCDPQNTCTATGYYRDHAVRDDQPYAVIDRAGRWERAKPITGTAAAGPSFITALSCPAPGDCSAAGTSSNGVAARMFTVTESGGTWHRAAPLRGKIPLLRYPADTQNITALTCTAPGQCTALGAYGTSADSTDGVPVDAVPFVAVQSHGTWSVIRAIHGLAADAVAWATSVSCASAGNCAAGGYWLTNPYGDEHSLSSNHAFLVTEAHGTWGKAQLVPGLAARHSRNSTIHAVACQLHRGCSAIGDYFVQGGRLFTSSRS